MTVITGVDAGGTKTVSVVGDGTRELGRAVGPAGAVRPGRAMAAASTIATAVRRSLAAAGLLRTNVLVVGAAGVGREEERVALRDALRIEGVADRLVVTTDIEIALEAAFGPSPGIVLLAGTGSFGAARLADGSVVRQGGYGWQMGDEGSAYAIGRAALGAAGRGHDGRGPATSLEASLVGMTRSAAFTDLVRWSQSAGPAEVASLAAAVLAAADAGDQVAQDILRDAAAALAAHTAALLANFSGEATVAIALAGGLLEQEPYRRSVETLLTANPRLRLRPGALDPVTGALAIAARQPT
jgi:N-acetylglucosamine kinase-like BadF-type ATPase